jgi:hypothetical protein
MILEAQWSFSELGVCTFFHNFTIANSYLTTFSKCLSGSFLFWGQAIPFYVLSLLHDISSFVPV